MNSKNRIPIAGPIRAKPSASTIAKASDSMFSPDPGLLCYEGPKVQNWYERVSSMADPGG